jgi:hypothetical protein
VQRGCFAGVKRNQKVVGPSVCDTVAWYARIQMTDAVARLSVGNSVRNRTFRGCMRLRYVIRYEASEFVAVSLCRPIAMRSMTRWSPSLTVMGAVDIGSAQAARWRAFPGSIYRRQHNRDSCCHPVQSGMCIIGLRLARRQPHRRKPAPSAPGEPRLPMGIGRPQRLHRTMMELF